MFWDGNGQSQRERVLSADYVFSATLPSAVPCRHHNGHLRELRREVVTDEREVVRAVVRAEAILVASRSLSPLERQPQLSDNRYAHGQESFPRVVCVASTTTTRPSSSAR